MAETNKTLRLTQVKSAIGRKPNQGRTLRALGLHGIGSTTEQVDNESVRGMISRLSISSPSRKFKPRHTFDGLRRVPRGEHAVAR